MKTVDIGFGAIAFEPNSDEDRISSVNIGRLSRVGVSKEVEAAYKAYCEKYDPRDTIQVKTKAA